MYNKLILKNEGEPFTVIFDGQDHYVPEGSFEVEEVLGNFIVGQAGKWKMNIKRISRPEPPKVKRIVEDQLTEISEDKAKEIIKEEEKVEKEEKKEVKKESKEVVANTTDSKETTEIKTEGKKKGLNFKL